MKIAIVGCGAMGSLIGGLLVKSNEDVVFIDPWQEHVDKLNKRGLLMEEPGGASEVVRVNATTDPSTVGLVDAVIFLVKGTRTEETIQNISSMVGEDTIIATFQNGIGNTDKIAEYVNEDNVAFGVIDFSAVLVGPGHINYQLADAEIACNTHNGKENTKFNDFVKIMNNAGINAYISEDANYRIWNKLVINANYNVLCGIAGIRMGELIDQNESWNLMQGITRELVDVANRKGIKLCYDESIKHVKELGEKVRFHYPSLSQDVARMVPTEIDYLNGAVVREGKKLGMATPYNEVVYNLMKVIERTYDVGKEFVIRKAETA